MDTVFTSPLYCVMNPSSHPRFHTQEYHREGRCSALRSEAMAINEPAPIKRHKKVKRLVTVVCTSFVRDHISCVSAVLYCCTQAVLEASVIVSRTRDLGSFARDFVVRIHKVTCPRSFYS